MSKKENLLKIDYVKNTISSGPSIVIGGSGNIDTTSFLLRDGSRAMYGNLDMGAKNINNVNLVDGVDIAAHVLNANAHHAQATGSGAINVTTGQVISLNTPGNLSSTSTNTTTTNHTHVIDNSIARSAVEIISGNGLTGGGDLTTNRTLSIGAGTLITVNSDDVSIKSSDYTYQFIASSSTTTPVWVDISTLAGDGLTSSNGILNVGSGTLITANVNNVAISASNYNYQFIASSSTTTPTWIDISTLAGDGMTSSVGVLNVVAGDGLTVSTNSIALTTPGQLSAITSNNSSGNHSHSILTDTAVTLSVSTSNATGNSSGLARANHTHAITSSSNPGGSASILASDGSGFLTLVKLTTTSKVTTPLIDTTLGNMNISPAVDLVLSPASNMVKLGSSASIQSNTYASQATGWRISPSGSGDFRYLYADEMHVKTFITDLEQALAGGQIIAKSVAILAESFTLPAAGGFVTIKVRNLPSVGSASVFQNDDFVGFKQITRTNNSLNVGWAWGTVKSYIDQGDGTQTWTWTRSASPYQGAATGVILADTLALDFGKTGNGYYEVNAIDGNMAENSPYWRIARWETHPSLRKVMVQGGNLYGLFSVANEYGLYVGNGGTSSSDNFLRMSNQGYESRNIGSSWFLNNIKIIDVNPTDGIDLLSYQTGDFSISGRSIALGYKISFTKTPGITGAASDETGYIVGAHGTDYSRIMIGSYNNNNQKSSVRLDAESGGYNPYLELTTNGTGTSVLKLISANFGVGTSSPSAPIDAVHISTRGGTGNTNIGFVTMQQGATNAAGYFAWFRPDTITRIAYLGWNDGGVNNLGLNLENGANFNINGGNVGIGTTSAQYKLDVNGSVAIDSPSGYGAILNVGQPATNYPGNAGWAGSWNSNILLNGANDTSISFHDAGNRVDTMRVGGGVFRFGENVGWGVANSVFYGNVGIGTSSPLAIHDILGSGDMRVRVRNSQANVAATLYQNANTGTTNLEGLLVGIDAAGTAFFYSFENQAISFGTNDTERMRILAGGNVGIGTTNPNQKLTVTGIIQVDNGGDSSPTSQFMFTPTGYNNQYPHTISTLHSNSPNNNKIIFSLATGASTSVDVMTLSGDGNVGIGTTGPPYKLNIVTPNGGTTGLFQAGISGITNGFTINTDASNNLTYSMLTGTQGQGFYQSANGNVGIGTSSPNYNLDVNGSIRGTSLDITGASGQITLHDRDGSGQWVIYNHSDVFRLWNATYNDRLQLSSNGALTLFNTLDVTGNITTRGASAGLSLVNRSDSSRTWTIHAANAGSIPYPSYLWIAHNGTTIMSIGADGNTDINSSLSVNSLSVDSTAGSLGSWTNVSFGSGWGNYSTGYQTCQYRRFGDVVMLRGLAVLNSGTAVVITTLPAGYRPTAGRLIFITAAGNTAGWTRIDVLADGNVQAVGGGTSFSYCSLDPIIFSIS